MARKQARRLSDATLELTGPARVLPDFLIVGAQRCGTTSMFKTLVQHPDVVRPFLRKGVHYFDKSYDRGEMLVSRALPAGRDRPAARRVRSGDHR